MHGLLSRLRKEDKRAGDEANQWLRLRCPVVLDEEADDWEWRTEMSERRQEMRAAIRDQELARLARERERRWATEQDSDSDPDHTAAAAEQVESSSDDEDGWGGYSTVRRAEQSAKKMRRLREAKRARRDARAEAAKGDYRLQRERYVAACEQLNMQILADARSKVAAVRERWWSGLCADRAAVEADRREQHARLCREEADRERAVSVAMCGVREADAERWQLRCRREREQLKKELQADRDVHGKLSWRLAAAAPPPPPVRRVPAPPPPVPAGSPPGSADAGSEPDADAGQHILTPELQLWQTERRRVFAAKARATALRREADRSRPVQGLGFAARAGLRTADGC